MTRAQTLSQALPGQNSMLRKALLVIGGSAFIAIAAQISVPMFPVPMTLQTLAILMVGFAYGSRLGAATLVAYLAQGAAGLPVFAGGLSTMALVGPTAGFLIGFVAMAWLAGFAAERGLARGFLGTALTAIVASAIIYIPGVAWPMFASSAIGIEAGWVGLGASSVWAGFVAPFLIGDAVKAVLAALIVTGAWKVLKRG